MVDVFSPAVVVLVIEKRLQDFWLITVLLSCHALTFASRWHVLDVLELIINSQSISRPTES